MVTRPSRRAEAPRSNRLKRSVRGGGGLGSGLALARGQPAQGQRAVSNELYPELAAHLSNPPGRGGFGSQQGELNLQAGEVHTPLRKKAMNLAQAPGAEVGDAQFRNLPSQKLIGQPFEKRPFLPGGIAGRAPVKLHPIQLALKPLPGGGQGSVQPPSPQAPGEGSQLGGHRELASCVGRQTFTPGSQEGLASPVPASGAIGIRRIKEREAQGNGALEGGLDLVVLFGVVPPEKLIAPGPGAHTDGGRIHGRGHRRPAAGMAMMHVRSRPS
jgi:hypothetical protein